MLRVVVERLRETVRSVTICVPWLPATIRYIHIGKQSGNYFNMVQTSRGAANLRQEDSDASNGPFLQSQGGNITLFYPHYLPKCCKIEIEKKVLRNSFEEMSSINLAPNNIAHYPDNTAIALPILSHK